MKCENEFKYTLEEAYDKIRRLNKFKEDVYNFYVSLHFVRNSIVEEPFNFSCDDWTADYVRGYNDATRLHASSIEHVFENYKNSKVVRYKTIKVE